MLTGRATLSAIVSRTMDPAEEKEDNGLQSSTFRASGRKTGLHENAERVERQIPEKL